MDRYLKSSRTDSPKVYEISRLSEFVELTTWLDALNIFRGQRQDWPLLPSIARNPDISKFLSNERKTFEEFKREAIPYLSPLQMPRDEWQWLALAQHNGLPTRLIDWTQNPLAALWFTVNEPSKENNIGVVWALHCEEELKIIDSSKLDSPFKLIEPKVYFPPHIFPYIQAQRGVFTVHNKGELTNAGAFASFQDQTAYSSLLKKIEIPANAFPDLRYQLFRMNVSAALLFPGLEGLAKRIVYDNVYLEDDLGYQLNRG